MIKISVLIIFFIHSIDGYRLNEFGALEMPCIQAPSTKELGLDLKWFASEEIFYVPLWSKLYAHRTASDLLGKEPKYISEYELGTASCLEMRKGHPVTGFGREVKYNMSGDASSISFKAPWSKAKSAQFSFHLTDNKSYILGVTCWEDNQSSWAVMSTTTSLEPSARMRILRYINSIGFNDQLAVEENYQFCNFGNNHEMSNHIHNTFYNPQPQFTPHTAIPYAMIYQYQQPNFNQYSLGFQRYHSFGHKY